MRYSTPCSRVSSVSARERLPIPASANSSVICSGVSIVILSVEYTRDLHFLD